MSYNSVYYCTYNSVLDMLLKLQELYVVWIQEIIEVNESVFRIKVKF